MDSIAKLRCGHQPFQLSLNHHRPSFPKSIPFISLSPSSPPSKFKFPPIKATTSQPPPPPRQSCTGAAPNQTLTPILKTACVTLTAAAALFVSALSVKPALATSAVPTVEPTAAAGDRSSETKSESASLEEQEKAIEEQLSLNPNDTDALRSLMEVRIKNRKLLEAIEVVDRLIELEPEDDEWVLLKAQVYSYAGEFEAARKLFEEILEKDPLRVEGYHGLIMASSESGESFNEVLKRIEIAMDKCRKEKKRSDLRDFKLLIAQIRVMEEKYGDALKVYEELVKEEPRDFRPYLCQGIIYTLMRKKDEADKKFEQFRKLVPKNHPYREYFLDNMFATKFFSEKIAGSMN